jgi:hypothetical protein
VGRKLKRVARLRPNEGSVSLTSPVFERVLEQEANVNVIILLALALPLLFSCAAREKSTIKESAGAELKEAYGFLRVYSAFESVPPGEFDEDQRTPYTIYTSEGAFFEQVTNRVVGTNLEPARVQLPVGNYIVYAQSDTDGWVNIPVTIDSFLASSIHVDGSWKLPDELETKTKFIRLPDGDVIGWYGDPIEEH